MKILKIIGAILFYLLIVGIFAGGATLFAYQHELVHKNIFYDFGCDSYIVLFDGMSASTYAPDCIVNKDSKARMDVQHNFNDTVGYHLYPILLFVMGIFIMLMLAVIELVKLNNKMQKAIENET